MTLSDLERLAREATPGPWKYHPWSTGPEARDVPPRVDLASGRTVSFVGPVSARNEDATFIAACDPDTVLALLQLARAVQDWSKIRHRGAADDDRFYQALAALNLKDET